MLVLAATPHAPVPVRHFSGTLRQIYAESLGPDIQALLRICVPYYYDLDDEYAKAALDEFRDDAPESMTHLQFLSRQFRRFSGHTQAPGGDDDLPRGNYFTVCSDREGNDEGTLAEELNAYRNLRENIEVEFADLLNQEVAESVGLDATNAILLIVGNAADLLPYMATLSEGGQRQVVNLANDDRPLLATLGIRVSDAEIDGVLDLRYPDVQQWFYDQFVNSGSIIPTPATEFTDILPELLSLNLGGSSPENPRLQGVGGCLRAWGVAGLVFPSARTDVEVVWKEGEIVSSRGWNFVFYNEAPAGHSIMVDLGGWETEFPPGVTLQKLNDSNGTTGWRVEGLWVVNRKLYQLRRNGGELQRQLESEKGRSD